MWMRWGAVAIALTFTICVPTGLMAQGATTPSNGSVVVAPTSPGAQVQQPPDGGVNWGGVGVGTASVLANVLYIPAKLVYALTGGLFGGGAYLLTAGNSQVANTIWRSSLGGDYVMTPAMVRGDAPIHFSGPTQTPGSNAPDAASSTMASTAPAASSPPAIQPAMAGNNTAQPMDSGSGPVPIGRPASGTN